MAIMPVMKSTIMSEFMMLNQWMSSSFPVLRYASQRLAQATSLFCHSTSYVKTMSVPGLSTASGSSSRLTGRCAPHVFMLPAHARKTGEGDRECACAQAGGRASAAAALTGMSDLGDDSARHGGARAECFCRPLGCHALLMSRPLGRAPGGSVYGARGAGARSPARARAARARLSRRTLVVARALVALAHSPA
jgi:hypothetical protein